MQINIEKRHVYIIVLFAAVLISAVVIAYNTNNPVVLGHSIGEIDGLEDYIREIANDEISGIQIAEACNLIYDSMPNGINYTDVKYVYANGIKNVSSSCGEGAGCVIKQEIYEKKKVGRVYQEVIKLTRFYSYYQDSIGNWQSTYKKGKNGDKTSTDTIPSYPAGSDYKLYLRDDYYKSGKTNETSSNQWTFIDRTRSHGMKVFICSIPDTLETGE